MVNKSIVITGKRIRLTVYVAEIGSSPSQKYTWRFHAELVDLFFASRCNTLRQRPARNLTSPGPDVG